jgi:hypothetical protein
VIAHGISDLVGGINGGANFPSLPVPAGATAAPAYPSNIDPGIVQYDAGGNLRTLNGQTVVAGIQYYLPPSGRVTVGANYTYGKASNIANGLSSSALVGVMKESQFFEATALGDLTPAVRVGAAFQRIAQIRGDDHHTVNDRLELSVYFFF